MLEYRLGIDAEIAMRTDDEISFAALRNEMLSVDDPRRMPVMGAIKRRLHRGEVLRLYARHVLERRRQRWSVPRVSASIFSHAGQKALDCSSSNPLRLPASEWPTHRGIIPRTVSAPGRQVVDRHVLDVTEEKMVVAEIGDIGVAFLRVDVVGEHAGPARPESEPRHAAAGEEFEEGFHRLAFVRTGANCRRQARESRRPS